ncbi:MAG: gamma-glutamyltransferase [Planctomycetota bacterium]|nr:MAG: gamma-glutamyltransferase [Planctomycetota bacterium]
MRDWSNRGDLPDEAWETLRRRMVAEQIEARGIRDPRLLEAFRRVPREMFVPPEYRHSAYDDRPLPIGHGQTISQPFTVAFMIDAAGLQGDEKVLEVGTGCGYAAAVLAQMCNHVHTIERIPELAEEAQRRLAALGFDNVTVHVGDGSEGVPDQAPFDAILVPAAAERLPEPLREQVAEGGRIIIPIGPPHGVQSMKRFVREGEAWRVEDLGKFAFVPLIGGAARRRAFLSSGLAALAGGIAWYQRGEVRAATPHDPVGVVARGARAAAATVHPLATEAALEAFRRGGNAIDAAVAASLMLSVVDGFNSGIGGGGLALVRKQDAVWAIDGRETAPAAARPELYYRNGKPDPQLSQKGPLAAGVPGLLALLDRLRTRFGRLDWKWALERAAAVAEEGFEIDANYVARLNSVADALRQFPESARVLLDTQGHPPQVGYRQRQPDLAATLRAIAAHGIEWFYRGPFAERLEQWMQSAGGVMTAADLANYQALDRQPIACEYRNNSVFGFPPPSSGGIHVAQMLGMLEAFDVAQVYRQSEARWRHLLIEVMKRAMADRAYWLGDADFVRVPRGLLAAEYLRQRAATIRMDRVTEVTGHGMPPAADLDWFGRGAHTTHLTTADAEGNVVALTQTINTTFGSKVIVPGTGVVLNNEMDDFSLAPGVPNAFGLLGSAANAVAPGKRPLSSMSPTIVVGRDGTLRVTCGAAGGPKIITTVLQILVRVLDLGQRLEEAVAAPRSHHQWSPDEVVCERGVDPAVVAELERMGHRVRLIDKAAVAQGISRDATQFHAASDPRVPSAAACL